MKKEEFGVEGIKKRLSRAKSESDWNKICDEIRAENGGKLPRYWKKEIRLSGFMDEVAAGWGWETVDGAIVSKKPNIRLPQQDNELVFK